MRRIGLLTSDFSLYHDLVRYLREQGVAFESLSFGEIVGPTVGVILTSWRDVVGSRIPEGVPVVAVGPEEALPSAVTEARRILEGVVGYHEVVVGIDPGKRPGVAVLGDGRVVHTAQLFSPKDVAPLVKGLLGQFHSDRARLRVGHGSPGDRDEILLAVAGLREEGVRIEIVDESGTTPATGAQPEWPPDVAAAIRIARTPGRAALVPRRKRVSGGQVREIQRESRIASGGRVTISRDAAARVGRGESSLTDAIDETIKKERKSRSSSR